MTYASHMQQTFPNVALAVQLPLTTCLISSEMDAFAFGCYGLDENLVPSKPSRRRLFTQRKCKVDGETRTIFVLAKGKPGGQTELRRLAKKRRRDNAAKLAYLERMHERAAREAIADALDTEPMGSKHKQGKRKDAPLRKDAPACSHSPSTDHRVARVKSSQEPRQRSRRVKTEPTTIYVRSGCMDRQARKALMAASGGGRQKAVNNGS